MINQKMIPAFVTTEHQEIKSVAKKHPRKKVMKVLHRAGKVLLLANLNYFDDAHNLGKKWKFVFVLSGEEKNRVWYLAPEIQSWRQINFDWGVPNANYER